MPDVFEVIAECNGARAGLLHTAHGVVETPVYMPVATRGAMRAIEMWQMEEMGAAEITESGWLWCTQPTGSTMGKCTRLKRAR